MDKPISTALLIVVSMIMVLMLFNVAYPAVISGGDAITSMTHRVQDQMETDIRIIHASGELDSSGWWNDTNSNGTFNAFIWVKNTGANRIIGYENLDVFFGPEGNLARIPHQSAAAGYPYWTVRIENDTSWAPTATLCIELHFTMPLASGRYFTLITTPDGTTDEYTLGI